MLRLFLILFVAALAPLAAEPLAIRVVAANLTSDRQQSYSPDNGNHSNPEGAGARILRGLKPDVVLIQEFNTSVPVRQWVNGTFGREFHFFRESGKQIPNGVISRFPIIRSGVWDDPVLDNREFAWALLGLPGKRELWVVSVHLHSKGGETRERQGAELARIIRQKVPADAWVLVGGDFNTRSLDERCLTRLALVVELPGEFPDDGYGNSGTNAPRNRPYDLVFASKSLERHSVPVELAGRKFPSGLVFDSRIFDRLERVPPVQRGDSGVPFMQHMAVVRDFRIP